METRNLLVDSVLNISQLSPERAGLDEAATAFNSFKRGVIHASSGRTGSPESLLGDLEPKGHVLKFLVGVYMQRRVLRKQVGAVLAELLHVDAWLDTLRKDKALCAQLPDDLASLLAEREEEEKEDAVDAVPQAESETISPDGPVIERRGTDPWSDESGSKMNPQDPESLKAPKISEDSPAPAVFAEKPSQDRSGAGRPKLSSVRSSISKAAASDGIVLPIRVAGPSVSGHYEAGNIRLTKNEHDALCDLLEQGRAQMEALDFSAADKDPAITAFETFRRAVQQFLNSTLSKQDDNILDRLEPKGKILEFLVDMYELHQKYRSRVTSTLMRLLNFDGWQYAADSDSSVKAAVADFQDMRAMATVNSVGVVTLNLKTAAANAVARGGVGALYVQVIAGYNLVASDSNGTSDPYVRVRLGTRTQRTHIINDCLNPTWNANPFIFEVTSLDAILKIECLDNDFFKDDPLGFLEMPVAQAPVNPEMSVMRYALSNVPHGELELKLLYLSGRESSPEVSEPASSVVEPPVDPCVEISEDPAAQTDADQAMQSGEVRPALWTPWGPAAAEAVSTQTESRLRATTNPFDFDSPAKQGGYTGVPESRKAPPPAISTAGLGLRLGEEAEAIKSRETSPQTAHTPSGTWKTPASGGTQVRRQTNPFDIKVVPSTARNPFGNDLITGVKDVSPRSLNPRNPFLSDLRAATL